MPGDTKSIKVLMVDDEEEFRTATCKVLSRRGFSTLEAGSGEQALTLLAESDVDVVLLDLKMPGLTGIETLQRLRQLTAQLPVIILTGHGGYEDALAGIQLEIVDFLQKPVDIERLAQRIRALAGGTGAKPLREATVAELMVPASSYARIYDDEPLAAAVQALQDSFAHHVSGKVAEQGHRSILVFRRDEGFLGLIRIGDVVKLVIPRFLRDSAYASFFTGMFLAQCKTLGNLQVADLIDEVPAIEADTPLMEAAHLMASRHLINLPVLRAGQLVGVLRDKDLLLEIAGSLGCR